MISDKAESISDLDVLRRLEQIKAMDGFPVAKGAAKALIRLTQRESTSLAVLAHALKADPTFSLRLIRVANGASGKEHRPVVSLREAVSVLGVPAVRALALGFSLLSTCRSGNCAGFDYARFWSHSLVRAVALQLLTGALHGSESEEAFSVGLLAQIGELALAEVFPQQYAAILDSAGQQPQSRLIDAEQDAFGLTHCALGASVLLDCGLPANYVEAVKSFELAAPAHGWDGSGHPATRHLLALADHIGDICVAPRSEWRALMPLLFERGAQLSLKAAALIAICDRVAHEWREWGPLLEIETGPMPCFEESAAVRLGSVNDRNGPVAPAGNDTQGMCILVVGDRERVRNPLCSALAAAGHSVFEAANGRQGLATAIELQPQIMLIDLLVEEMDGIELTRTLRQFKVGRSIYVLILTGKDDDEKLAEAFAAGADDFLSMPVTQKVLVARMRAGRRVVRLQEELERDHEEIRRISAELSASNQQLQDVGMTDILTGCPNRRYAMDRIEQEWAMTTRSQRPLACMVINIDNFKQVNDSHGHDVGDTVLKLVASAFKDEMRAQDVLARIGGDEFLVICPDTTLEAAMACAERMREVVETLPIVSSAQHVRGSVSVGVAVRDAATRDSDELIRIADQSAYLAKRRHNTVAAVQFSLSNSLRSA